MTQPGESDSAEARRVLGGISARILDSVDGDYIRLHDEAIEALIRFAKHLNAANDWDKPQLGAALGGICGGVIAAVVEEL